MASKNQVLSRALILLTLACVPCIGSNTSCVGLGFSSNLVCSSCRELKEFKLEELETDCLECCQDEGEESDGNVSIIILFLY